MVKFTSSLVVLVLLVDVCVSRRGLRQSNFGVDGNKKYSRQSFEINLKLDRCGKHAGPGKDVNHYQKDRYKRSLRENASNITPEKYIYGGETTGIAQYPWLVHIAVKKYTKKGTVCYPNQYGEIKFCRLQDVGTVYTTCGGSLVSSRHVITAAHCFDEPNRTTNDVKITLAEYNTQTGPKDCVGTKCVINLVMHPERIHIHSGYVYRYGTFYNDIAMLKLKGSAPYTDYIRPICLPTFNINSADHEGTLLTIAGWGHTESGQKSYVKQHTQVHMVAPDICKKDYSLLTEHMLCAAGSRGEDACNGDSGGPIMRESKGTFYLVGVVSAKGGPCGSPMPTKYTNVFSYMNWILEFLKD